MIIDFPFVLRLSKHKSYFFISFFRPFDYLRLSPFFQKLSELAQVFFLFLTLV